jgi:hypothetical protein
VKWRGCGRNWSWPNFKNYICPERVRKAMKSQSGQSESQMRFHSDKSRIQTRSITSVHQTIPKSQSVPRDTTVHMWICGRKGSNMILFLSALQLSLASYSTNAAHRFITRAQYNMLQSHQTSVIQSNKPAGNCCDE